MTPTRLTEACRNVDSGTIGQRYNGTNTRDGHEPPAHLILPDDSQQAAVQDDDLFTEHPPDDEQRLHQYRQVGDILDKLLNARLELHRSHHAHLEPEVTQGPAQVVIDGDGLGLQQFAMGQQHSQLLTPERLHMHWTIKPCPHHLGHAPRIVAVGLVDLCL
jgi:hypothetical protein